MKHSHYKKDVKHLDMIDVYRVLRLFSVNDPAIAHAVKKLLVAGGRGAGKDAAKDVQEAIDSLERWKDMNAEDNGEALAPSHPMLNDLPTIVSSCGQDTMAAPPTTPAPLLHFQSMMSARYMTSAKMGFQDCTPEELSRSADKCLAEGAIVDAANYLAFLSHLNMNYVKYAPPIVDDKGMHNLAILDYNDYYHKVATAMPPDLWEVAYRKGYIAGIRMNRGT